MRSPETESSEQKQNTNEQIASQMQAVLSRVEKPQNRKALSDAGYEFANERYDTGQQVLEKNGFWHDAIREIAAEANSADRDKKGNVPITFTGAKEAINGYAKSLADLGTKEDKRDAFEIESIVRGTERPGIEGIDDALKYIEGVLKSKASLKKTNPETKQQWDEQRAVRDALFAEKRRRIDSTTEKRATATRGGLSKEEIDRLNQRDKVELEGLREMFGLNEKKTEKITVEDVRLKFGLPKLDLKEGAKIYNRDQGAAVIFEIFKQLNPDAERLIQKIENLKDKFGLIIAQEKKSNPGKSEEAYENFANNKIFGDLEQAERQTIEDFLDANYKKLGGSGHRLLSAHLPFSDFMRAINSESQLKVGDMVQWTSQGAAQFKEGKKISHFSEDGKWVFVEGSVTGIPIDQLTFEKSEGNKNKNK